MQVFSIEFSLHSGTMQVMMTLYLTADEQKAFTALPADLRDGWEVVTEDGKAYEGADVLSIRARMASFEDFPAVQSLLDQVVAGESIESLSLDGIPETILHELLFTIGAKGISSLMNELLQSIQTDEHIEGLLGLSLFRHDLLETNATVSYA